MSLRIAAFAVGSVAVLAVALIVSGASPLEALATLLRGSLGSPTAISGTLRETSPLLLAGVAVYLGLRAGLFNIGVEGQFVVGAIGCAWVALRIHGILGVASGILVACLAGALWALPAGLIKAYRGGHEVITTIMLNNVAGFLTAALVAGPLKDPTQESATTRSLDPSTRLPEMLAHPFAVSSAVLIAILGALVAGLWLGRTVKGYELRAVGANPVAASFAGISVPGVTVKAMTASGAIAGLAGAVQVLAYEGRFYAGFSPGYGFTALGVALLAGGSAVALIPAALLFGVLERGGISIQLTGVPKGTTLVVFGVLIVFAAAFRYRKEEPHD